MEIIELTELTNDYNFILTASSW